VSRSRHCSLLVVDFFSLTVSVIKLLCSLDRPLGRGVHRTLTFSIIIGKENCCLRIGAPWNHRAPSIQAKSHLRTEHRAGRYQLGRSVRLWFYRPA